MTYPYWHYWNLRLAVRTHASYPAIEEQKSYTFNTVIRNWLKLRSLTSKREKLFVGSFESCICFTSNSLPGIKTINKTFEASMIVFQIICVEQCECECEKYGTTGHKINSESSQNVPKSAQAVSFFAIMFGLRSKRSLKV